jgi:hypothetical protein
MRNLDYSHAANEALRDFFNAYLTVDALVAALVKAGPEPSRNHVIALSTNFALLKIALDDLDQILNGGTMQ